MKTITVYSVNPEGKSFNLPSIISLRNDLLPRYEMKGEELLFVVPLLLKGFKPEEERYIREYLPNNVSVYYRDGEILYSNWRASLNEVNNSALTVELNRRMSSLSKEDYERKDILKRLISCITISLNKLKSQFKGEELSKIALNTIMEEE